MRGRLAADAALPARDALLDPARAARVLARGLGQPVGSCAVRRVKYRVGESLRVLYEVESDRGTRLVATRHAPGRSESLFAAASATAAEWAASAGAAPASEAMAMPPVAHDPVSETVLFAFPHDRRVRALPQVVDTAWSAALAGVPVAAAQLVAYAPEKAATVRCEDAGGRATAYVKAYAGRDAAATAGFHRELAASGCGVRVPHVLALADAGDVLAVSPLAGECLGTLRGRRLAGAAHRLGAALARLHSLEPPAAPAFGRHTPTALRHAAELVARARPDVAGAVHDLAASLESTEPAGRPAVWLHGDVHLKNAILTDGGLGLIDLDQIASGPVEGDLGSLLASVRAQRVCGSLEAAVAGELETEILAGYASERGAYDTAALHWHTSAALLTERVLRAVNRVRPDVLTRLGALVVEARQALTPVAR